MVSMQSASQWVVLAHILRPQGRKGEVLADLFTDFPERFSQHPLVWLATPGLADSQTVEVGDATRVQPAEIAAHWLPVGKNAGRVVLHFVGVDSIEQAEKLAGKEVIVPLTERLPLDSDAAYISDLIGCTVFDRDQPLGTVEDVEFPATPDGLRRLEEAAPLLTVKSATNAEILIPFVNAYLLELNVAEKQIRMALPEGLIELNHHLTAPSEKD